MNASQFEGQNDPVMQKPSPTPNIIIGIIVVLGLGFMVWLGMQEPKRETPPPPPVEQTETVTPPPAEEVTEPTPSPAEEVESTPAPKAQTPPTAQEIVAAKAAGTRRAKIVTEKGDIIVELYGKEAPQTVANFVKLTKAKFYDGLNFHRVEPNFVIQGGDPNGNGSGDPGYSIKLEISKKLRHVEGALAMARSNDPDSAGCQFYITLAKTDFLDDQYAVFGKVVKGMDVVKSIAIGDRIEQIKLQ